MKTLPLLLLVCLSVAWGQPRSARVTLDFGKPGAPLEIDKMALGQGGLSEEPMWEQRLAEVRALHPRMIRLFVQEYYDVLPETGKPNFASLDRSVDLIRAAGAIPLLAITFKPASLFPVVDQDVVEPKDYAAWEALISAMVRHYQGRGTGKIYWEVSNEPDIGEDGGSPYRFKPESYARYYEHTVNAIRRADPGAAVGGPALANWKSPILPALLKRASEANLPLNFVSWHIYTSDPNAVRQTIDSVRALVKQYPSLSPELILNEWNIAFDNPIPDPQFQPAYILETIWQMKDAGLDYSCYYQIREYHVEQERFAKFFSAKGAAFMANWWNRMPQYDGLFDFQNTVRPSYFAFKLLSRLRGARLPLSTSDPKVHGFLTYDENYKNYYLLLWNFSEGPVSLDVALRDLPFDARVVRRSLDGRTANGDENFRLPVLKDLRFPAGESRQELELGPFGIQYWEVIPSSPK
ncbi:MAG: hypothetical protein KJZ70_12180 [Bryobacterales bacterium]|nr:hypothetical protein [Bryobacterales bacterium]